MSSSSTLGCICLNGLARSPDPSPFPTDGTVHLNRCLSSPSALCPFSSRLRGAHFSGSVLEYCHSLAHTHTHTCARKRTHTHTHALALSVRHCRSSTDTQARFGTDSAHSFTQSHTHTHTHTHTLTHVHTLTHTHTHTHVHTHTQAHCASWRAPRSR